MVRQEEEKEEDTTLRMAGVGLIATLRSCRDYMALSVGGGNLSLLKIRCIEVRHMLSILSKKKDRN